MTEYKDPFFGIPLPGPTPHPHNKGDDDEDSKLLGNEETMLLLDSKKYSFYLEIYRKENYCIMASYFSVGFCLYFTSTPVYYYMIDYLGASSTKTSVLSTLQSLPWSFKILYGLLSDSSPILGYRRKPYLLIGWLVFLLSNLILVMMVTPSITNTIAWNFFMMCGLLLADVCTDTMSVERAKLETEENRGTLQSLGYTFRALGGVIGAVLGAVLYNKDSWGWGLYIWQIYLINGLVPFVIVMAGFITLVELAPVEPNYEIRTQLENVWSTLQLRAVWRPMAFIYTYNVFQVSNGAWTNYLVEGLDFSDFDLGLLTIAGALMTWVGLIAYREYFFRTGWQKIYIFTTILGVFFSFLQILLIYQVNQLLGIPNLVFALGDTTFGKLAITCAVNLLLMDVNVYRNFRDIDSVYACVYHVCGALSQW
jgi:MFS family permease